MKLIAIWAAKFTLFITKLLRKKGTVLPGRVALKICPNILKILSNQVKKEIICVCGTNGKTTTNNLIRGILEKSGHSVVCNSLGANMTDGITTAFILKTNFFGKLRADYATIEIDEAFAQRVFCHFVPAKLVIINLFRDQLDRYGELDTTIQFLENAIKMADKATLILNADDPITASLGVGETDKLLFGISENLNMKPDETKEGRFCRFCGHALEYDYYYYSQLGMYECKNCGFKRETPHFSASNISLNEGISLTVCKRKITTDIKGFYNIYNLLAAFSVCSTLGITENIIAEGLKTKMQLGRMEEFIINQKKVILNLAKNPTSFNQSIESVLTDKKTKNVMLIINDNDADGNDVSWLWDVDFEKLNDNNILSCYTGGIRSLDMANRLKYAEIDTSKIVTEKPIENFISQNGETAYIISNYTALFETQSILKELEKKA